MSGRTEPALTFRTLFEHRDAIAHCPAVWTYLPVNMTKRFLLIFLMVGWLGLG